jgi:pyruvate/2-oxoglutarate/acetoin dehydrogenase E1 component
MAELRYRDALRRALYEEMKRDERVFIMGEDVGAYGGAYQVTAGLLAEFGTERVRDTPLSEAIIVGAALGAAMVGGRPVAEIMYVDFAALSMDQIVNQAAKIHYMFGGQFRVPLVIRTQQGTGRGAGAQHSQSLESWFTHVPGLKVIAPAAPRDAYGLLKAAIRDDNPVVFLEHKGLYAVKGEVEDEEFILPIGMADVKRDGTDLTLITYSRALGLAIEAAEAAAARGISVEVVDLRTLKPLDVDTLERSARKTGRVIVLHEAVKFGGMGAEISAALHERLFGALRAPIQRVAAHDVPLPANLELEKLVIPDLGRLNAAIDTVMQYQRVED